jgi:UDP:flavonoid glycosyltransferase YjiC (YdhE family)
VEQEFSIGGVPAVSRAHLLVMSRVLLAWEWGRHLGHVTRLRSLAVRLKARHHEVLAVVRDIPSATHILGPVGVSFLQGPWHTGVPRVETRITGYADLLLSQGWSDRAALWATLQSWLRMYELFQPEAVVLDYAPTACLAARLLGIPRVLIGTGFELPPAANPLPPIPGFAWATQEAAASSERRVLENVNAVLDANRATLLTALHPLVEGSARFLTTFAELDHYGPRNKDRYVGSLADPRDGRPVAWPESSKRRVFAYLRPDVPELPTLLEGLAATDAGVIAYVPGMSSEAFARFSSSRCVFSPTPVSYASIFGQADVCLSYAPAGTVTRALLSGVPQLMMPVHMESQLTAQRVASQGMGRILPTPRSPQQVIRSLQELMEARDVRLRARGFAERYRGSSQSAAVETVVECIEGLCRRAVLHPVPPQIPCVMPTVGGAVR